MPATIAPSRASRCATASPIAPVAPVTRATFPARFPIPAASADGPGGGAEADLHDLAGDDAVVIGDQVEDGPGDVLRLQVGAPVETVLVVLQALLEVRHGRVVDVGA